MTPEFQSILFYVFIGFFVLIGVLSLLVLAGIIKSADKDFKKWAVNGFVAAVAAGVVGVFNVTFNPEQPEAAPVERLADFTVFLSVPTVDPAVASFTKGSYSINVQSGVNVETQTTAITPPVRTVGELWELNLPGTIANKATQLDLVDDSNRAWRVQKFYPNRVSQNLSPAAATPAVPPVTSNSARPFPTLLTSLLPVVYAADKGTAIQQRPATTVSLNHEVKAVRSGKTTRFDWRLFVADNKQVLDRIAQVEYTLPSSFLDPFKTSRDRAHAFEISGSSLGDFPVLVEVKLTNGDVLKIPYHVTLRSDATAQSLQVTLDRIEVDHDGSSGATGWEFDILIGGRVVMHLPIRNYDDGRHAKKRENLYLPDQDGPVSIPVPPATASGAKLEIKGTRSVWLFSSHTVDGASTMTGGPMAVKVTDSGDEADGTFTFHFTVIRK